MAQAQHESRDESSPFSYKPAQTLLLILDYHSLFVNHLSAEPAAEKAIALKQWAQSQHILVAHALIDASADAAAPTWVKGSDRAGKLLTLLKASPENYDEPAGLKPDFFSSSSEMIFRRTPGYVSALTSHLPVDIRHWLQEQEIKSLILCGLSTSGCVLATAMAAADAGFVVSVIEDACQARDEKTHKIVVEELLRSRAYIFSLRNFVEAWKEATEL